MLCSLLVQLLRQNSAVFQLLEDLCRSCRDGSGQQTDSALLGVLKGTIRSFSTTYIVLDALDECILRTEVLEVLQSIILWRLYDLYILVTSRREGDIKKVPEPLVKGSGLIDIQNNEPETPAELEPSAHALWYL
ncbi:MAG: hypothetical protein Q9188_006856 [Gyalolechia gomerana]